MANKAPVYEHLDLDNLLGKPKNRVVRMGVELEGGWKVVPDGAVIERDGSVFGDMPQVGLKVGEITLGPIQPAQMPALVRKYYPTKVDATCGLHVHMAFDNLLYYALLMEPEYQESIVYYLATWAKTEGLPPAHPIWPRLNGDSRFCQKKYWPEDQIKTSRKDHDQLRQGHRYTIINYCHGTHGTIECRVLPMLDRAELAIRAIRRVLDITNACLVKMSTRSKYRDRLELAGNDTYEEYIEEVL